MAAFCKSSNCPSSDRLLAFYQGRLPSGDGSEVRFHLLGCDFCSAEYEFYVHFPQLTEEEVQPAEIPAHLYQLAEAILNNRRAGLSALRTMIADYHTTDSGLS